ncbi:MAG: hypothetical protein ACKVGW_18235, partial [Verrucomicrobiia bacterium]
MKISHLQRLLLSLIPFTALFTFADIPAWRVGHNGIYEATNSPVDWTKERLFEIPLETKSNGTPILVDGKLFYTAEPALLICADSKTGETLWSRSNDLLELANLGPEKRK